MKEDLIKKAKHYFRNYAYGSHSAKNIREIEQYLGCNNRTTRATINILRTQYNMPIISLSADNDVRGYFLYAGFPEDKKYVEHFVKETYHRINEIRKIVQPAINILKPSGEQLYLF